MAETIASFDDKRAKKFLGDMLKRAKDVENPSSEYAAALTVPVGADIARHFQDEAGPGGPWPEWSETYKGVLAGLFYFRNINGVTRKFEGRDPFRTRWPTRKLQDTGRLRGSFRPGNVRVSGGGIMWYNPAKTSEGFPYAEAHDEGGPKLPQREFMWLSDDAMRLLEKVTLGFMLK